MNKIVWRIAEEAFLDKQNSLIPIFHKMNIDYVEYKFEPIYRTYSTQDKIDSYTSVYYGPINFINQINYQWCGLVKPGIRLNFGFKNVNCTDYYGMYPGKWLLNSDMVFIPFGMLRDQIEDLLRNSNGIFIRPNSSKKSFTGLVLNETNYLQEIRFLEENLHVFPYELIGVCRTKKIGKEFRFWIVDKKVVTYSEYSWEDDHTNDEPSDTIKELAEKISKYIWEPDNVYTVDICDTLYGPKIVELNSFCSAGMYNADQEKIIKSVHDYTCTLF